MPIPITNVQLGPEVEASVLAVIRSGMIAQGPVVAQLEKSFSEMTDVKHVVAVNNGTTALIAALEVLYLQPGDEVITSPFTFVATLNAILSAGATARFADISAEDFNVTTASLASLVNERTKVLMPVHLYGQVADMNGISALADTHQLHLVEDAAQAHLATLDGRAAGTWGIGCFSLYATKNLTSGEGGLISTNDDAVADRLRVLRNQGMRQRYQYEMAGNNYRMTDLQAAVCVPQLGKYEENVRRRNENALALNQALADIEWVQTPLALEGRGHVWHQYTILVRDGGPVDRDELIAHLTKLEIGCGIYYPKIVYDYDCYREDSRVITDSVPVAEDVVRRCVSLPVHPGVGPHEIEQIAQAIRTAIR